MRDEGLIKGSKNKCPHGVLLGLPCPYCLRLKAIRLKYLTRCVHGIPLGKPCQKCLAVLTEAKAPPLVFKKAYGATGVYSSELFEALSHFQGLAYTDLRGLNIYVVLKIPFAIQSVALSAYNQINKIIRGERGVIAG